MSIYIEKYTYNYKELSAYVITIINVSTGLNKICSINPKYEDIYHTDNEIKRLISYFNPKEILFHIEGFELSQDNIIQKYDIFHKNIFINNFIEKKNFKQKIYQNELLQKVFHFKSQNTPIVELNLERREETLLSYIYMLEYIYEHKISLIENIFLIEKIDDNKFLLLSSDSARQINLCDNYNYKIGKHKDVISLLNYCSTIGGSRLLRQRFLYPLTDSKEINNRYEIIELLLQNDIYEKIKNDLRKLNDFEKSLRLMGLNMLSTNMFHSDLFAMII